MDETVPKKLEPPELPASFSLLGVGTETIPMMMAAAHRPVSHKHLQMREKDSHFAKRRSVVTDATKASCRLSSVIGYNGRNATDNMVWNADADYFAYSVGSVICVENVKNGKQMVLHHPFQVG